MHEKELEMIRKARQGDDEAFADLFEKYVPIVEKIRKNYHIHSFDKDDWIQEGMIAFFHVLKSYDPAMHQTLGTYYKRIFSNRIRNYLRKQLASKRQTDFVSCSLEEIKGFGETRPDPDFHHQHCFTSRMIVKEGIEAFDFPLSDLEAEALKCYFSGAEFSELEKLLGLTRASVYTAYIRGKNKMIRQIRKNGK